MPATGPSKRDAIPLPVILLVAFIGTSCAMALVVLAIHWLADMLARALV